MKINQTLFDVLRERMQAKGLAIPKQRLQSLARAAQSIPNNSVRLGAAQSLV